MNAINYSTLNQYDWHFYQSKLYKYYYPLVFRIIERIIDNKEDSKNITHDVFIKGFEKIQEGYLKDDGFKPWISRLAHNQAIDFLRKSQRTPTYSYNTEDLTISHVNLSYTDNFDLLFPASITLSEIIGTLPENQQRIIIYRFVDNLSFNEIQIREEMIEGKKTSINTLLGRMRYALTRLKKTIKASKYQPSDFQIENYFIKSFSLNHD